MAITLNRGEWSEAYAFLRLLTEGKLFAADENLNRIENMFFPRDGRDEANGYVYEQSGVWVVPAYRLEGRKLDSIENIGITKQQLEVFLR